MVSRAVQFRFTLILTRPDVIAHPGLALEPIFHISMNAFHLLELTIFIHRQSENEQDQEPREA